jgi:hypothetical protein
MNTDDFTHHLNLNHYRYTLLMVSRFLFDLTAFIIRFEYTVMPYISYIATSKFELYT